MFQRQEYVLFSLKREYQIDSQNRPKQLHILQWWGERWTLDSGLRIDAIRVKVVASETGL